MSTPDGLRRNAILRRLPDGEFQRVRSRVEVIDAEIGQQLYQPGEPITEVYFPLTSVYSLVALADGRILIEVATIGHEGMVGLPLFLGATSSPHASNCQIPGQSARLTADGMREVLHDDGVLHQTLNRLTQATMVQVAQNVVCNNSHELPQPGSALVADHPRPGRKRHLPAHPRIPRANARRPTTHRLPDCAATPTSRPDPLRPRHHAHPRPNRTRSHSLPVLRHRSSRIHHTHRQRLTTALPPANRGTGCACDNGYGWLAVSGAPRRARSRRSRRRRRCPCHCRAGRVRCRG